MAMTHEIGGINFDAAMLDIQVKRDAKGMVLLFSQQPIGRMNIVGLTPIVVGVQEISRAGFHLDGENNL